MKLSEYLPEVGPMQQKMQQMNSSIEFLDLMKASGTVGQAPTIGLDHIVNTWVRHQMAYRQQLVQDLMMVAMSPEEISGPLTHITNEVFRRGIEIVPKVENPDSEQLTRLKEFLDDCNVFDQSLEEVLRQFHFDVNSIDDAFLYFAKEYKVLDDGKIRSKVKEIRRLNPALVEFDLDSAGLPKNAHFLCPIHRDEIHDEPTKCKEEDCEQDCHPVMYKYYHRNKHIYLFDTEIVHVSKFSPSETYGWSPILTIFEKALTIIGMDKNLFRYFFERKMPASMMMVFTDDPESLRRERQQIAAQTRIDPNYIPMVAVSSRNQRGRVELLRLFHTLQEMDYLPVRNEIRERIAAMWGVTPAWQGAPEAFGGLSTQTQQLVVMSRVVEGDQRVIEEKIFPRLLEAFNITDYTLRLPNPEEKAEATRISFAQQRAQVASMYLQLGYDVKLKDNEVPLDEAEFIISGEPVPMAQMQGEQMAMGIEQMQQQGEAPPPDAGGGPPTGVNPAPGNVGSAPAGGESPEATPLQMMHGANEALANREKDVDTYFDNRAARGEERQMGFKRTGTPPNPMKVKTWASQLMEKGYSTPLVKDVTPNGKQVWFTNEGVDYIADLGMAGIAHVEKARFINHTQPEDKPGINYNPSHQRKERDEDE